MTKFELPEKPKKTNTSEDFNNLRKAVDELDKFDYTWKTYANKADRRINAANKHIEELERENQRLVAENLAIKTLVDSAKPQQALPVVPDFIGKLINTFGTPEDGKYINYAASYPENKKELDWIDNHQKTWLTALLVGFTIEKPQLFYLRNELTGQFLAKDTRFKEKDRYFFWTGDDPLTHSIGTAWKLTFTHQEIDSMQTGSYELVPVEDGE